MARKLAQVIVDIPLMQTDKPFSYAIPKDLEDLVQVGVRVHVPFGRGNRLLQGFVVGFRDDDELETKDIAEVLDFEPVLNQEQLDLADQMRHTVFSYKISILKSMLPSLLNSQYDKLLLATDTLPSEDREDLFGHKTEIVFSSLSSQDAKKAGRLIQKGFIEVQYLAKDNNKNRKDLQNQQNSVRKEPNSSKSEKETGVERIPVRKSSTRAPHSFKQTIFISCG